MIHHLWFGYFWPSLQGNGPEDILHLLIAAVLATLIWPPAKRWWQRREAAAKAHAELLHSKLDHIIKHHPDIPPFNEEAHMPETDPRVAGKRGVRKSLHDPEMRLSAHGYRAVLAPDSGDVTHGIVSWGMDHNDELSCCGWAAADHNQVSKAGDVNLIGTFGGGISAYFNYGIAQGEPAPTPDEGVEPVSWLNYCVQQGWIEMWGELDPSDSNEVHQAMLDFGGVMITVDLTDDAEQLFEAHQPWTLANGESPDPADGHFVVLAKYDPTSDTFVTWGGLQAAQVSWDAGCITGAYAILTTEDAQRTGIDVDSLKAKIASFGQG